MNAAKAKAVYNDESVTTDDARLDQEVASCGDYTLNSRDVQIFFAMQYYGFLNENGMFASLYGLDTAKPLYEQTSMSGDLTWEQYFVMASMEDFQFFAALASKAAAEGYVMAQEDREQLDSIRNGLQEAYAGYGFDSVDAFVQANFGPSVRYEDYARYLELYFYAMSYQNSRYRGLSVTDADRDAYYDNHPEEFEDMGKDQPNVNVRHILIALNTNDDDPQAVVKEAKDAAKAKAEQLLNEYLTNPTEDHFAELAKANTEDPGSKDNGGLYEDVYPGWSVEPFNDWCFDPTRQPGDTGIVETAFGYHVMYFVSKTDTYQWKVMAEDGARTEQMNNIVEEIVAAYPITKSYEKIVLCPLPKQETN